MAQHDPFAAHSFDPETLRLLSVAFSASWHNVERHVTDTNRQLVRNAIAEALVDLANAGSRSERSLEAYATDRARVALQRQVGSQSA